MKSIAIILVNVGTPESPSVRDVRKYLSEFLNDKYVINLPFILRRLLVNGIIVPFRSKKSSKLYQELWTEKGSPLLYYSRKLQEKLQDKLLAEYKVFLGMRYGNPSLKAVLETIKNDHFQKVLVLPLYPQYASSTTESVIDLVQKELKTWNHIPELKIIDQFYNHPKFVNAFVEQIKTYEYENYDHIIFSYHGLPLSHIIKIHPNIKPEACNCENELPSHGEYCYKATCYETTRLLMKELLIPEEKCSVGFQSRLTNRWLSPFTDELILKLLDHGKKRILVVAPSFVADCLETNIEIEKEYKELFLASGGKELTLVKSLNDSELWVNSLNEILTQNNYNPKN